MRLNPSLNADVPRAGFRLRTGPPVSFVSLAPRTTQVPLSTELEYLSMPSPVYALNLFNVSSKDEYLAYSRRSANEAKAHGGSVIDMGKFREAALGDVEPRNVLILVEWTSKDAFDSYRNDPSLVDLHPHRVNGTSNCIWHLFDKLEDLKPVLK
jgi:uncharacterized protein (DUF1330 family)